MKKDNTNTHDTAGRSWLVTLPAEEYSKTDVEQQLSGYAFIGQMERGEEGGSDGYRHWQLYIENDNQIRFSTLRRKFPKGHFEPRKGSKWQAYAYVTKEKTSEGVRVQSDTFKIPKKDKGVKSLSAETIREKSIEEGVSYRELLLTERLAPQHVNFARELEQQVLAERWGNTTRDLCVEYIYGAPGCGKTSGFYEEHGYKDVYSVSTYSHPWDAYNGESIILMDEFSGQMEFEFLLKLLDRYPLRLPARYADRWAAFNRVVMLSNLPMELCYPHHVEHSGDQWEALCRRIDTYRRMDRDGTVTSVALAPPGTKIESIPAF